MTNNKSKVANKDQLDQGRYHYMHIKWWSPIQSLTFKWGWFMIIPIIIIIGILVPFIIWIITK
jgi:hypothetical protein